MYRHYFHVYGMRYLFPVNSHTVDWEIFACRLGGKNHCSFCAEKISQFNGLNPINLLLEYEGQVWLDPWTQLQEYEHRSYSLAAPWWHQNQNIILWSKLIYTQHTNTRTLGSADFMRKRAMSSNLTSNSANQKPRKTSEDGGDRYLINLN